MEALEIQDPLKPTKKLHRLWIARSRLRGGHEILTRRVSIRLSIVSALDSDPKPIDGKRVSPTAGHHPGTQCLFWNNSKDLGFFLNLQRCELWDIDLECVYKAICKMVHRGLDVNSELTMCQNSRFAFQHMSNLWDSSSGNNETKADTNNNNMPTYYMHYIV